MAAQDYTSVVQQLYISYFGRPADYYGLQNFSAALNTIGAPTTFDAVQAAVQADTAGTSALSKLVNTFNASAESTALYGSDNSQIGISKFVSAIYQNVLGRAADTDGFNFWVNAITSGTLTKANAAAAISAAAMHNTSAQGLLDAQTVANKVAVATTFTADISTSPAELTAYSGDAAAASGRSLIAGVSSTTNLTAYNSTIQSTIDTMVNGVNPGTTYTLTSGVDTLVGSAGNDIFNALNVSATGVTGTTTLNNFDSIDGGAGNDMLNIYASSGVNDTIGANLTVKNVETVNIYNTSGTAVTGLTDASKYAGVTALWQIGTAPAAVTNLATGTTAGFRGATTVGTLSVGAADAAISANVALDGVVEGSTVAITSGAAGKLAAVTLSGGLVDGSDAGTGVGPVNLNVTVGKDVQTLTVNTAVAAILGVTSNTSTGKVVTTINAANSTGAITYTGAATTVANITTGSGSDHVTLVTATAVDNTATTANDAISASLSTGAGNDVITVSTTGAGTTTVDAGAGNDSITISVGANNVSVTAGAGDDTITLAGGRALGVHDMIDGGDGTDTIAFGGTSLAQQNYEILTAAVTNVEIVEFTDVMVGADAAKLSQFGEFDFDVAGASIVNVADAQSIVTVASVTASAAGYTAGTSSAATVYAGTLHVDATGGTASTAAPVPPATTGVTTVTPLVVTANANSIELTVNATAASASAAGVDSYVSLTGDVKSATVDLVNSTNAATSGTSTGDAMAHFSITTGTTGAGTQYTALGNLTSITLTGNGIATIDASAGGKLATIDASGMTGVAAYDATQHVGGLNYTANTAVAETITLGGGHDFVSTVSTYDKMDTITGLTLTATTASAGTSTLVLDTAHSDDISVGGATFVKAAALSSSATTLGLALSEIASANSAASAHNFVFQFGGDTYVFMDTNANGGQTGTFDSTDVVVKLTGAIDLDLLTSALSTAHTTVM